MKNKQTLESVNEQLARLRHAFVAGNRSAFLEALLLAAHLNPAMPVWIRDEALEVENGLESGRFPDANDAFGYTNNGKKKRVTEERRANRRTEILAALVQYRLEGGSLTRDIYTQTIADKLCVSTDDVEFVYNEYGKFIKELPKKRKNRTDTNSFADITLPSATVSATA